jgi:hypothetical protein
LRNFSISQFGGVVTGVDSRALRSNDASDMRNVRTEDGSLSVRYGYRNIAAAQTGATAVYGCAYLQGYSGTTEVEEYGTVETVSGNTRPFKRHVTTGAATELTNGGVSLALNASEWAMSSFQGDSYWINPANAVPVFRHAIGTNNSFTPLTVPSPPSVALSYAIQYGGGSTPYSQLSFLGINPATEITYQAPAASTNSSLETDNSLLIGHNAASNLEAYFEVDLNGSTAGNADWQYNDIFGFTLGTYTGLTIDPSSVRFQFQNADGSPITFVPSVTEWVQLTGGSLPAGVTRLYGFRVEFDKTDQRGSWDNIRRVRVTYRVLSSSGTATNNKMYVAKPTVGGVWVVPPTLREPGQSLGFNYSYYYSGASLESGLTNAGMRRITLSSLQGIAPYPTLKGLGVHVRLTFTTSGDANVDNNRLYVEDPDGNWRRVVTQTDATAFYDYKITWNEVLALTAYTPNPYSYSGVTNAFAFKGSMVWLYQGGYQNVRFSRVGSPEQQSTDSDSNEDQNQGATFSLSDNFADEPLFGIQAGDAAIIAGKLGVYAMIGARPIEMTPPKKVPGSFGVAGKFAGCRWKDDSGNPGLVWVSKEGQAYFCVVSPQFSGDEGSQVVEITSAIRSGAASLREYLVDGQPLFSYTDLSSVRVWVDEATDSLWIALGRRALVFRRPSLSDGARHWEPYEYDTGTSTTSIAYAAPSTKRRVRFMRSSGTFDEMEWNSSTGDWIEGTLRDGGSAMPGGTIYWQSHAFVGPSRRLKSIKYVRDDLADTPTITSYSSQRPGGVSILLAAGYQTALFPPTCIGTEHFFRITLTEGDEPGRRIEVEEYAAGGRRRR